MTEQFLRVTISPNVLLQELEGEAIVLHLDSESYFGLDSVGLRIWQLLEQHGHVEGVVGQMLADYDVPEEQLRQDINDLLAQLVEVDMASIESA